MKAILKASKVNIPNSFYSNYGESVFYATEKPETIQDIGIYGDGIEFDVRMISTNGFKLPCSDCDINVEMKFTFTPKTPKSETITLK